MIKLKKSLVEHSLNHANFQIRALAETEHIKHLVMQSEIEQLDKLLTLLYLVKEWTLPLSSWNQIILGVFFKLRNPFRDILWEKINQISIVGLIRIQFIPDFFSLPATNSFNSSGNTKVVKYPSIKFLTVSFVPYLRNRMNQILVLITQLNQTTNIANNQESNTYIQIYIYIYILVWSLPGWACDSAKSIHSQEELPMALQKSETRNAWQARESNKHCTWIHNFIVVKPAQET